MAHRNRWCSQLETSIYKGFSMAMLNNQMIAMVRNHDGLVWISMDDSHLLSNYHERLHQPCWVWFNHRDWDVASIPWVNEHTRLPKIGVSEHAASPLPTHLKRRGDRPLSSYCAVYHVIVHGLHQLVHTILASSLSGRLLSTLVLIFVGTLNSFSPCIRTFRSAHVHGLKHQATMLLAW